MTATLEEVETVQDYESIVDGLRDTVSQEVHEADLPDIDQPAPPPRAVVPESAPPPPQAEAPAAAPPETQPAEAEALANNFRLAAGHDPVTQLAFTILKEHQSRGEHIRPSVAEAMAVERLAALQPAAETSQPEASAPVLEQAEDPALVALRAQDAALAERLKTAVADFDDAAQAEIHEQRAVLGREIVKAELRAEMAQEREAAQAASAEAAAEAALAQSRATVMATYGEQAAPGSVMGRVMQGIALEWQAAGDPRFADPRLPELAAQEAAKQLGITPPTGSAATAPPVAQPPSAPQAAPRSTSPVAPPIAPGSARSSDPGTPDVPDFRNSEDYAEYIAKSFGRSLI